jgi:integrase
LADRIKKLGKARDEAAANRPWREEECRAVLDHASPALKLPIALAMTTGLRKADLLSVKRSAIRGSTIALRTSKRGTTITVPLHQLAVDAIAERPASEAEEIAVNSYGERWTESGLAASWCKLRIRLEKQGLVDRGLTLHGLRHTLATRLREAGADDRTIADVLGQESLAMARHYSADAALPAHTEALVRGLNHTQTRNVA